MCVKSRRGRIRCDAPEPNEKHLLNDPQGVETVYLVGPHRYSGGIPIQQYLRHTAFKVRYLDDIILII